MAKDKEQEAMSTMANTPIGVKTMNIYEKLSAISIEITHVAKNLEVGYGSSKYKAVGEADVLAAVRPLENQFRVYSYPFKRTVIESGTIESVKDGQTKKQLFERIETVYRFLNIDKPDEFIDITTYGDGIDTGDKSVGKAMTYGDKYALLKAYKIITGDDPDQNPSEELKGTSTRRTTPKAETKKGVSPELVSELQSYGVTLEQIAHKKGVNVSDLTDEIVMPGLVILRQRKKKEDVNKATSNPPEGASVEAQEEPAIQNTNDEDFVGD